MKDIGEVTSWYEQNQLLYGSLANKVADILRENIEGRKLQYHSITHRPKSLDSFIAKARREKYTNPREQINDMAGVRVITYLEADVRVISGIIEDLFDVDLSNSLDQAQLLGSDRVGYRSVHYVARFDGSRCRLPEYKRYVGLPFEIQVRSLLQHAWAEIEHDRNYKFGGKLPTELERRFYLVAGSLEMLDREFVAIAAEIEKYKAEVKTDLERGDLDIEITTASLAEYLSARFGRLLKDIPEELRYGEGEDLQKVIVEELELFGLSRLDQLDRIIPKGLEDDYLAYDSYINYPGVVREILMINDIKKYFKVSWRRAWSITDRDSVNLLAKHGVDIKELARRDIDIV